MTKALLKRERRKIRKRQHRANLKLKKSFKEENYNCYYCKNVFEKSILTIEHIIPLSFGGSNDLTNITLACKECNQEQGRIAFMKRKLERTI